MLNVEPWRNGKKPGIIRVLWKELNSPLINHSVEVQDPVCRVKFSDAKYAGAMVKAGGKEYYFCSVECRVKFLKDPEKYLGINEDN